VWKHAPQMLIDGKIRTPIRNLTAKQAEIIEQVLHSDQNYEPGLMTF